MQKIILPRQKPPAGPLPNVFSFLSATVDNISTWWLSTSERNWMFTSQKEPSKYSFPTHQLSRGLQAVADPGPTETPS